MCYSFDLKTLIIFGDVQQYLKGECEKYLSHMVNNRRHAKLSLWFLCQNYKTIPLFNTKISGKKKFNKEA